MLPPKEERRLSPKAEAWAYVIVGGIAVISATYFLTLDSNILDWLILGLGIFSVGKGIKAFWELKNNNAANKD